MCLSLVHPPTCTHVHAHIERALLVRRTHDAAHDRERKNTRRERERERHGHSTRTRTSSGSLSLSQTSLFVEHHHHDHHHHSHDEQAPFAAMTPAPITGESGRAEAHTTRKSTAGALCTPMHYPHTCRHHACPPSEERGRWLPFDQWGCGCPPTEASDASWSTTTA